MNSIDLKDVQLNSLQDEHLINPNLGIGLEGREKVVESLKETLANTYMLMLKTQNYHWNIRGKIFIGFHELTEGHYNAMWEAVDVIAERIRSLGDLAPGSFQEFAQLGSIQENKGSYSQEEMIRDLVKGHEILAQMCRKSIPTAEDCKDYATADMLTERLAKHEQYAWMYRSFIEA